jgi:glycolate oxidase
MGAENELIERVKLICGDQHVMTDPALLSTYRSDGIRRDCPLPAAVVLPGDATEVASVVRACADTDLPYAVRGAGTSESGGALPPEGGLLIVLTRMRQILSVDLDDDEITVQPGATTDAVSRAVAPTHSFLSDGVSTVGGAVAEGTVTDQLTAMQLVAADGTLVRVSTREPGYDVCSAFHGSRGTRGIAVALTLQLERVGQAIGG